MLELQKSRVGDTLDLLSSSTIEAFCAVLDCPRMKLAAVSYLRLCAWRFVDGLVLAAVDMGDLSANIDQCLEHAIEWPSLFSIAFDGRPV